MNSTMLEQVRKRFPFCIRKIRISCYNKVPKIKPVMRKTKNKKGLSHLDAEVVIWALWRTKVLGRAKARLKNTHKN